MPMKMRKMGHLREPQGQKENSYSVSLTQTRCGWWLAFREQCLTGLKNIFGIGEVPRRRTLRKPIAFSTLGQSRENGPTG